jgi:putative methionine-R-sulfoxide reductase with GAF domain
MAAATAEKATTAKTKFYNTLHINARRYLASTRDPIANLSNIAALLYHDYRTAFDANTMNWCGFYLSRLVQNHCAAAASSAATSSVAVATALTAAINSKDYAANKDYKHDSILVLGPFQGLPAVTLIPYEKGVCGTAAVELKTQLVPDVHSHPNHIACDTNSQSEIVVPIILPASGSSPAKLIGVLDIDSPVKNGFDATDQTGLEALVQIVLQHTEFNDASWQSLNVLVDWNKAGVSCVAKKH